MNSTSDPDADADPLRKTQRQVCGCRSRGAQRPDEEAEAGNHRRARGLQEARHVGQRGAHGGRGGRRAAAGPAVAGASNTFFTLIQCQHFI